MTESGNFKLIIEDEEGRRSVVPVELGEISIGRLDGNTIRLNERNVSRRHARFVRENGHIVAEDLDSYNGVWINGDRIKGRQPIHDGDTIRIGDFQLELRGEGLQRRTEETTQRTVVNEGSEVTRPDIRMDGSSILSPQAVGPESTIPREAPPVVRARKSDDDDDEPRHEPTALIRMDQLQDESAARRKDTAALAGQKAKLICVSTLFAGQEFEVDKAEIVIGRTDDNDIPIDHRSVSRHHAKISVSGRSYRIADLKSANGTLVNGEEYAQIELKKGDLIELGHVKFRFVPPGESYDFTADELVAMKQSGAATGKTQKAKEAEPEGPARPNMRPLIIGGVSAAVVVIIGITVAVASMGDDEETQPSVVEQPGAGAGAADGAAPQGVAEMVKRAQGMLAQGQWREALKLGDAVLVLEPNNAAAQEVVRKARGEISADDTLNKALAAVDRQDWAEAAQLLEQIPEDSAAHTQARALLNKVRASRVQAIVESGSAAIRDHRWEDVREINKSLAELDPGNAEIDRMNHAIEEGERMDGGQRKARSLLAQKGKPLTTPAPSVSPATAPPAAVSTPVVKPATTTPPAVSPTPAPAADAKTLYQQGIAALQQQQNERAIDLLDKCVKADAKFGLCYRALGIAHARMKNGPKAARFYRLYLKVMPNAPDAAQVEQLLKSYEGEAQ